MKNFEDIIRFFEETIEHNEQQKRQIIQKWGDILPYLKNSEYWLKQAINRLNNNS